MPVDLRALVEPAHTVLVTQECQVGVIGETSTLALKDVAGPIIGPIASLANAARDAGVPVIHCVAWRRKDDMGSNHNARIFAGTAKTGLDISPGSIGAEIVPEIGPIGNDLVLGRYHGLGPMGGTDLSAVCRNLNATTIIGVGVSVNIGMLNFAMDAVNAGYQFVMPRDCVAGIPTDYADAVIANTLSLIATVTSSSEIQGAW